MTIWPKQCSECEKGAVFVEYVMLLMVIGVGTFAGVEVLGLEVLDLYNAAVGMLQ